MTNSDLYLGFLQHFEDFLLLFSTLALEAKQQSMEKEKNRVIETNWVNTVVRTLNLSHLFKLVQVSITNNLYKRSKVDSI